MTEDEKRGKFLCELRKQKKLTQQELGELIHYSDKNISKWERGISFPNNPNILKELASIFDVSIEELMYGEFKTKKNENQIRENFISEYENNYNLYKKRLHMILTFTLIFVVIGMIVIYLIFIKNSVKAYTISLTDENDVVDELNSTLLITNKMNILSFSKINLKEEKSIENIVLYYGTSDNKNIILEGQNDNYYIEEKAGYEEYHLNQMPNNPIYLEINYEDDGQDVFLLKIENQYSNDNIFPETVPKATEKQEINPKDINTDILKELGYEEKDEMYTNMLNDTTTSMIDIVSFNITIQDTKDNQIETVFANINSNNIFYKKIQNGKSEVLEKLDIIDKKDCNLEKCNTKKDYAMYINYLREIIN